MSDHQEPSPPSTNAAADARMIEFAWHAPPSENGSHAQRRNGSQTAELGAGQPAAEPEPEDPYDDEAVKYKLKWVIDEEARKTCLTCRLRKRRCDQERPGCDCCARAGFVCVYAPAVLTYKWLVRHGVLERRQSAARTDSRATSGNNPDHGADRPGSDAELARRIWLIRKQAILVSKDSKPNSVEDTSDSVKCGASEAAMKTEPSALQLPDEEGSGNDAEDAAAACVKQMKLTSSDDGGEYCIICNNGEDVSEEKGLECEGGACSDASVRRRSPILAEMEGEWTWVGWSSG
ncbi:hypothetical protein GTA08_BOTSDO14214 [Botryosphaeria dothidea]|uniref:Zn(2)-C6 fungal-type domain-containing protein n=1 Tax=Botryosphaeria dothidea TaxID=55169 RepID=A0A8H4N3P8_9PEZI|nr:hypothetical protein GTA08_BOTSDO14214 [Botryosphaeria dothidea]